MSRPNHADRDEQYTWDTDRIFATPADWDRYRESLQTDLDADDPPSEPVESTAAARDLVDAVSDWYRRAQRLELYATLRDCVTDAEAASDRARRARDLSSTLEAAVARRLDRLRRTDKPTLDRIERGLDERRHYFASLRRRAARQRSPDVEAVIEQFAEQRTSADRIVRAVTNEDFAPPTVETPDGEERTITQGRYRRALSSPDREYRRTVYESYLDAFADHEGTLATAYAEKLSAASALAEVRGFDSIRELQLTNRTYPESGLEVQFPQTLHETLIESVADAIGPRERARDLRAERLGVEMVRPWDTEVSLADDPEPELSYERARDLIVGSLAPLGEKYQDLARDFFASRRVDVYECADKRSDIPAFCPSSADDGAFVLLNFTGDVRTAFYLAHELGHALHVEHYRSEPTMYATGPRPVSEIPSLLHELLLAEHLIDRGGPLGAHARNRRLEALSGMLYGQAANAAFKRRLAAAVDDGETLSAGRIADASLAVQSQFDPALEPCERSRYQWLTGQLFRDAFHHYQYVLGAVGALHVRESLREDRRSPAAYREFLRTTGQDEPLAQFERLGIDLTTSDPYERATSVFDGYLDEWT